MHATSVPFGNTFLAVGGVYAKNISNAVREFIISEDKWTELPRSLEFPVKNTAAALVDLSLFCP